MKPLYGLVLAGGASRRMGQDKAALSYRDRPQLQVTFELLAPLVERCFVSVRTDQSEEAVRARFPQIVDAVSHDGPASGLLSAHAAHPDVAWLVLACDLPMLDAGTLRHLIAERDEGFLAVSYRSEHDGQPEPLCAIWEPEALAGLDAQVRGGRLCPRKILINSPTKIIAPFVSGALDNINTPDERVAVSRRIADQVEKPAGEGMGGSMKRVTLEYFAQLRELVGAREQSVETGFDTVGPLYEDLRLKYAFPFEPARLRVAINGDFAPWTQPLKDGDHIVFIPPVTGG